MRSRTWAAASKVGHRQGPWTAELPRRAALERTLALLAVVALPACASDGTRSITLSQSQLNDELLRRFPLTRRVSNLLDVRLLNPRVQLLPERNALGTQVDISVTELLMGSRHDGHLDLDYGLRFDAPTRTIRLTGVHVKSVDFSGVPTAYRSAFSSQAPRVAEQLLENLPLHEIKREQLDMLGGMGFTVGELRVTPQGLRIELVPSMGKP